MTSQSSHPQPILAADRSTQIYPSSPKSSSPQVLKPDRSHPPHNPLFFPTPNSVFLTSYPLVPHPLLFIRPPDSRTLTPSRLRLSKTHCNADFCIWLPSYTMRPFDASVPHEPFELSCPPTNAPIRCLCPL